VTDTTEQFAAAATTADWCTEVEHACFTEIKQLDSFIND